MAPRLLVPLGDEEPQVLVRTISQLPQDRQLSLRLVIRLDLQALCTVDQIFGHAYLDLILHDVVDDAPGVQLIVPIHLFPDFLLDHKKSLLKSAGFEPLVFLGASVPDFEPKALVMVIGVELEQVLSR